jgi:hypothetical protein
MKLPVSSWPVSGSYTQFSSSAWPMPCTRPPCTWPSTIIGLMMVPKSSTAVKRSTRVTPVAGSISTSQM